MALLIGGAINWLNPLAQAKDIDIASLQELAHYAGQSGNIVRMKPGVYRMIDFLPLASIPTRRERKEFPFLAFSGNDNVFQLAGVTIEFDTALRAALRPPIHSDEFVVSGNNITIQGLTITNVGDGASHGGAVLGVAGTGNELRDCTLLVRGSSPYGYGDLFGKGGYKHSAVHIIGKNARFIGCKLSMRSFGHGFYIQEDAENLHFESCEVEGVMRSTDEILTEKSGLAVEREFRTDLKNRAGEARVTPGYMKALSEDAFRTYSQNKNLTFKNCTAKNMRGGFELRTKAGVRVENCTVIGCERGYWVSNGAVVVSSKGDVQYGPLLFVEGDNAVVELELMPTESKMNVHALATIFGTGSKVTIRPWQNKNRARSVPIMVGYGTPAAGSGMAPIPERAVRGLTLTNETTMPVVVGPQAVACEIITHGKVGENSGKDISIKPF